MKLTPETKQYISTVAGEILKKFGEIESAARERLDQPNVLGANSLASVNTLTSELTLRRMEEISKANRESYQILAREPAIARVVVEHNDGKQVTYYICRTAPLPKFANFAGYRAPIGRLASLPIRSEFNLPNGNNVEIVERSLLRPLKGPEGWDSRDTLMEAHDVRPITIESLRELLPAAEAELTEDLLERLLTEETLKANVVAGIRRAVITKMELRDQPVLDQYQDEIFRLPLSKRLLILGPPGTGKTTTLIRRLGQKLDTVFLNDEEQELVQVLSADGTVHISSWLMFTPTQLLKQYLKEAFGREGVPASDFRIRTWHDYRRELGRNVFGILRTPSGGGPFVLKDSLPSLKVEAIENTIEWFSDFDRWQRETFLKDLHDAAQSLSAGRSSEVQRLGQNLSSILNKAGGNSLASILDALITEVPNAQTLVTILKEATDSKIKSSLNLQLNGNRAFLQELARFIDGLQTGEIDDADILDAEEEEPLMPKTELGAAANAYMQAVRAQARAFISNRSLNKNSRNGKIIEWLGKQPLEEADSKEVGASLMVQADARRFVNPAKRYINGVSKRYRAFRRMREDESTWYNKDSFMPTDLHPLELDLMLLTILKSGGEIFGRSNIMRQVDEPLKSIFSLYTNQILVDEATDFSPVQLACMAAMAHPRLRSFFACGDFNQRLTLWGSRSDEELKWVFPDLDIKEMNVSYRQSRQLNELAKAMIYAVNGKEQTISLPSEVDNEGVAPVLLESASETSVLVNWLANRIRDIDKFVGQLPSTAIFVNSEEEVSSLAQELNAVLVEHNIQVVACPQGQVMGQDNDVRVFDIQHIKGLEFESVFFIGVDRLAALHPKLYDKYLYVGMTRAATYLGVSCDDKLPSSISGLRPMFAKDWRL